MTRGSRLTQAVRCSLRKGERAMIPARSRPMAPSEVRIHLWLASQKAWTSCLVSAKSSEVNTIVSNSLEPKTNRASGSEDPPYLGEEAPRPTRRSSSSTRSAGGSTDSGRTGLPSASRTRPYATQSDVLAPTQPAYGHESRQRPSLGAAERPDWSTNSGSGT